MSQQIERDSQLSTHTVLNVWVHVQPELALIPSFSSPISVFVTSALQANMHKSPRFSQPFTLVSVDLSSEDEIQEMIAQRKICGWNYERSAVEAWKTQIDREAKIMWWIVLPAENEGKGKRAGHVGLASESFPPDPDLARADHSIMTVSSFFILPQHRAGGLGRASWLEVEKRARAMPECKEIAIDTWDGRYNSDPEWRAWASERGVEFTEGMVNEDWYARMGFVKFKSVPRYPLAGTDDLMGAVFMRKSME